ncbi:MAG: methyltransferase, partial [Verrucomicrobia bacterium]|nr:methyltransferase [Verrucomicrobiota bacterium]
MNIDTKDWKLFYLKDLYKIEMGNGFDKSKMSDDKPSVNFVSRVSYNNGVDIQVDKVKDVDPYPTGLLTV